MADVDYDSIVKEGKRACTYPSELSNTRPVTGSWTVQDILGPSAGIIVILTLFLTAFNIFRHLRNYTCPLPQRQTVRILLTPLVFGFFNFLAICFYDAAYYIIPVAEIYESLTLIALFYLFLTFVVPESDTPQIVELFFASLTRENSFGKKKKQKHDRGSLRWLYVNWILCIQVLPVTILRSLITWISHGTGCPLDTTPTVVKVLKPLSMICWLISIFRFYGRLRPQLRARNAFWKFFVFKLIVMIQVIQEPIFQNLLDERVIVPTAETSYRTWDIGIPAMAVCGEMLIIAGLLGKFFGVKEYAGEAQMGIGQAALHALNIFDLIAGCAVPFGKLPLLFGKENAATRSQEQDQQSLWDGRDHLDTEPAVPADTWKQRRDNDQELGDLNPPPYYVPRDTSGSMV